jgi:hypothetical protein
MVNTVLHTLKARQSRQWNKNDHLIHEDQVQDSMAKKMVMPFFDQLGVIFTNCVLTL